MSAAQETIEESVEYAIDKAHTAMSLEGREDTDRASAWALIAIAEAVNGVRQALTRGDTQ